VVHFEIPAKHAVTEEVRELAEDVGDATRVDQLAAEDTATLVGRFGPRSRVQEGDKVRGGRRHARIALLRPGDGSRIYDDNGKGDES
jgi:hypothetical protein